MRKTSGSKVKGKPRGRPQMMESPRVTSVYMEERLLLKVQKIAYAARQSVNRWLTDAALERLARDKR